MGKTVDKTRTNGPVRAGELLRRLGWLKPAPDKEK